MSDSASTTPAKTADVDPVSVDDATTRDKVWDATLSLLADRPLPFQTWRVRRRAGLSDSQDRTIRRTLSVMGEAGWLDHEPESKWWYPGPKAGEHFDVEWVSEP